MEENKAIKYTFYMMFGLFAAAIIFVIIPPFRRSCRKGEEKDSELFATKSYMG
jgi:hypothetical protein